MRNRNHSNLKTKTRKKLRQQEKQLKLSRKRERIQLLTNVNLVIGIDNGTTGTICSWILKNNLINFIETPVFRDLNYQKEIIYIDRLDHEKLKQWINLQLKIAKNIYKSEIKVIIILERPMVNPQRFDSTLTAIRSFESLLVILQQLNLKYIVIDSKEWQHYFFGKNTIFMDLKLASLRKGIEFVKLHENKNTEKNVSLIRSHGDADALLITKYAIEKLIKNLK